MNGSTTYRNRSAQRIYGRDIKWPAFRRGRQSDVFGRDKARLWRFPQLPSLTPGCVFGRLLGVTAEHLDVQVKNAIPSKGRRLSRAADGPWRWHEFPHFGGSACRAKDSTMPAKDSTMPARDWTLPDRGPIPSAGGRTIAKYRIQPEAIERNAPRIQYRLLLASKCQFRRIAVISFFHWEGMFGSSWGCTDNNERRLHGVLSEQNRAIKYLLTPTFIFASESRERLGKHVGGTAEHPLSP